MALLKLVVHYPEAGHTGETIALISEDYFEDLTSEQVALNQFQAAMKIVRKRCKFFPKVADILEAKEEYCRNPERFGGSSTLQIMATSSQHDPTSEELELSAKIREIAGKAVRHEISFEEHDFLQEELKAAKMKFYGRLQVVRG